MSHMSNLEQAARWLTPTAHMRLRVIGISDITSGVARTVWEIGMDYALESPSRPITLAIASDGGEVFEGIALHNVLRDVKSALTPGVPLVGVVTGNCFSMASYILQACDYRYAAPTSFLMVHGISQRNFSFDEKDGERNMALLKQLRGILSTGYAQRSGKPLEFWEDMLQTNTPNYFTAAEAFDLGLIDEIR